MVPAGSVDLQPFSQAVQQAIGSMHHADVRLREWRSDEDNPDFEYRLLQLISLTALVEQRGRHLQPISSKNSVAPGSLTDLPALLRRAYDDLVIHLPADSDHVTLQFVVEVGAVYRGVVRHVERA